MAFDHIDNYSALLDEIIKREKEYNPGLSDLKIIEELIGILFYWYNKLMSGVFPMFNDPTSKQIRSYLEDNYALSFVHQHNKIKITDVPVKYKSVDTTKDNRGRSRDLKELYKGNFNDAHINQKARNELRRLGMG